MFSSDAVTKNYIYKATGLTAGSLKPNLHSASLRSGRRRPRPRGSALSGEAWPVERGTIRVFDVDPINHDLYIVTGSVILDNDSNGLTTYYGGVWKYDLDGNPSGNVTSLFQQNGSTGPVGLLYYIEVDPATGQLLRHRRDRHQRDPGDGSVWIGGPPAPGTPTFARHCRQYQRPRPAGPGDPRTLALTLAPTPTYTETAGSPSAPGTAAVLINNATGVDASDVDSVGVDQLAGAQVRISVGFLSGASHQDLLTINGNASGTLDFGSQDITYSYDNATGVMTLSGVSTFANYESAVSLVRYRNSGDNPTDYGTNTSRTLAYSVFDGLLYSDEQTATVNVDGLNDAPVNDNTPNSAPSGAEDGAAIAIVGLGVSDVDADPASQDIQLTLSVPAGRGTLTLNLEVASGITAADITGGAGAAAGVTSIVITATQAQINATLAAANGLSFTPAANVNGTVALTMTTNDLGLNGSDARRPARVESDSDIVNITVTPANDAPTVTDGTETLGAVNEDSSSAGASVSSLFGIGHFSDATDNQSAFSGSSPSTFAGIAVVTNGSSGSTGQWQYFNGAAWTDIGTASTASAQLINAATLIRFNPMPNFNGLAPTLTAHLVESGAAFANGADVNLTGATGGTTRYSAATVTLDTSINAVNDAPNVINGTAATLAAIDEDSTNPAGNSVTNLFSTHFSDADDTVAGGSTADDLAGIAITGNAAAAEGAWQYRDGVGGPWTALPSVSAASAFLLALNAELRFVPAANYNGAAPLLTVHLVDDSSGPIATGGSADVTTTGDPTRYSSALTLGETVTSISDAPVAVDSTASANEDQTITFTLAHFQYTDANNSPADDLASITITSTPAGGTLTLVGTGTITPTGGSPVTVTRAQLMAGNLKFIPTANASGTPYASFTFTVRDDGGTAGTGADDTSNNSATLTINLAALNDAPVASLGTDPYAASENAAINLKNTGITVSDIDAGSASVTVTLAVTQGVLNVTAGGSDAVVADSGTGTVTITGTLAQIDALLNTDASSTVTYINNTDNPSATATLTLQVNDGGATGTPGALTSTDTSIINITPVNDAPTVSPATLAAILEDNFTAAGETVENLFAAALFIDPDNAAETISGILVSANTANAATEGAWQYSTGGEVRFDIGPVSAASALALDADTLIRFVPVEDYFGAPPALTVYGLDNTYVGFTVDDTRTEVATTPNGDTTAISDVSTTLGTSINAVNDAPVVDGANNIIPYEEQDGPGTLAAGLTLTDVDSDLASATVKISVGFQPGDTLHFTDQNGITGFYNAATGVLTLSGTASVDDYQAALRSVTFSNATNNDPTDSDLYATRSITWQVNDGTPQSGSLFAEKSDHVVGNIQNDTPLAIGAHDVNGDGRSDIVIGNVLADTVQIFRSSGAGFGAPITITGSATRPPSPSPTSAANPTTSTWLSPTQAAACGDYRRQSGAGVVRGRDELPLGCGRRPQS